MKEDINLSFPGSKAADRVSAHSSCYVPHLRTLSRGGWSGWWWGGGWELSSEPSPGNSTHLQSHSCLWLPLQDRCLCWLPHSLERAVECGTVASGYQKYNYKPGKMNHCHLMEISRLNVLANINRTWMPPLNRVKGKG